MVEQVIDSQQRFDVIKGSQKMKWFFGLWNGVYIRITPDIANFDPDIASS